MLVRGNPQAPDQHTYHIAFARKGTTLAEMAGVASLSGAIEECFQSVKRFIPLNQREARS